MLCFKVYKKWARLLINFYLKVINLCHKCRQSGFIYRGYGPFTKNKERIEKFMQIGNTDFIYKNELDKTCFQHDMVYGKSNSQSQ